MLSTIFIIVALAGVCFLDSASFCIILLSFPFFPSISVCVNGSVCVCVYPSVCFPSRLSTLPGHPVFPGPGCPVTTAPSTPADTSAPQNAPPPPPPPQPGLQSQAPSFPPALLRPPLPSLPYLVSPSCLSYSLLSASLGATRSVVMPTNTPAFSPIIATPSPVKNDVPIVQDAAGTYPDANQHCSCQCQLV